MSARADCGCRLHAYAHAWLLLLFSFDDVHYSFWSQARFAPICTIYLPSTHTAVKLTVCHTQKMNQPNQMNTTTHEWTHCLQSAPGTTRVSVSIMLDTEESMQLSWYVCFSSRALPSPSTWHARQHPWHVPPQFLDHSHASVASLLHGTLHLLVTAFPCSHVNPHRTLPHRLRRRSDRSRFLHLRREQDQAGAQQQRWRL